jgi:hypothetical protein
LGGDFVKDQLYLLRPGFVNATLGPFYCSDSLPVEGLLSFFPQLRKAIDVHYIEFPRPRAELVRLLGDANQSIPVLVLADRREIKDTALQPREASKRKFFADERSIRQYLSTQYGLPQAG